MVIFAGVITGVNCVHKGAHDFTLMDVKESAGVGEIIMLTVSVAGGGQPVVYVTVYVVVVEGVSIMDAPVLLPGSHK